MSKLLRMSYLCLIAGLAYGQGDRGTITGTVADLTGAVVPSAKVTATNPETGNTFTTETTDTGNFTLPSIPNGEWDVLVEAKGFKKFRSEKTLVQVAQTTRLSVILEVGSASESITVEAQAVTLKTEGADQSTTVSNEMMVNLPISWANGWFGNQAVRNPLSIAQIMPGLGGGTSFFGNLGQTGGGSSINGAPPGTFKILVEGQDTTPLYAPGSSFINQTSVEALQEFTLQSSNYSAEFGQAQGGIFNFTTKSGTNQYHGGAFYRLTNEDLNAHQPYTGLRLPSRQNNYGFTVGGPLRIPRVYDGRNKTFLFFSFEGFRSVIPAANAGQPTTVPSANDRAGNFQSLLGAQITCPNTTTGCKDALGNAVYNNQIFDPLSLGANGVTRLPFANNSIPANRMDSVALKVQGYLPTAVNSAPIRNWILGGSYPRPQYLPSLKIDHNLSDKLKLSIFDSGQNGSNVATPNGLPDLLTAGRIEYIWSNTTRLSTDYTLRPTMLLHLGVGYVYSFVYDTVLPEQLSFDNKTNLGLKGTVTTGFPRFTGLGNTDQVSGAATGGMALGVGAQFDDPLTNANLTTAASLSWVSGAHSYKFGGNWDNRNEAQGRCDNGWGRFAFAPDQTGQPGVLGTTSNGRTGLNYASFLLGLPNSAQIGPCNSINWFQHGLALYAQDTWKVSRKLTLDYGLRYDLQSPPYENRDRIVSFSPSVANPTASNRPGGVLYQGFGLNACQCKNFMDRYPFAFGPRIAAAYQIDSKTVIRAAAGLFYGVPYTFTGGAPAQSGVGTGADLISFGVPANSGLSALPGGLQGGLVYDPAKFASSWHLPGAYPTTNPLTGLSNQDSSAIFDRSLGRPPRIYQFNVALQREISRGMTVEAAYVANRGVWLLGQVSSWNSVTPAILAANNRNLANAADRTLLAAQIGSAAAKAAGLALPFAAYPLNSTYANALRPYPQYGNLNPNQASGRTWYDSLQVKLNARLKRNITALGTYTWAKSITRTGLFNDFTKLDTQKRLDTNSIPQALQISVIYQTPHLTSRDLLGKNIVARNILRDWSVSAVLRYQSGALITAPTSNNTLGTYLAGVPTQYMVRDPSQPLYLVDPNGHIDPTQQLILNPKAWAECGGVATFGCGAPSYTDFRQRRTPQEQIGLGRRFQITDKAERYFEIRFDITNPFNRIVFPDAAVGNPLSAPAFSGGQLSGGFGFMNVNNIAAGTARNMLVVARLAF